jgi:ArsR family transcriptional regulator, lead/cadmium/zinc/bismuth-responsive transcriptional repressor
VSVVRRELMSVDVAERIASIFKILGDPGRCRLVAALIVAGELCVCDLATSVGMTVSNASHHLRVLRSHGLVRARRAGKMVYYSPDDAHVRVLLEITREHVRHGSA